jgi:hypothetical protein
LGEWSGQHAVPTLPFPHPKPTKLSERPQALLRLPPVGGERVQDEEGLSDDVLAGNHLQKGSGR